MNSKILYIDMDNVLVDFPSGIARLPEEVIKQYEGDLDEVPEIFSLMDPIPGAIAAFENLASLYDTYILSTAPWENPSAWSDKLLWVKRYLGKPAYKRLILSHHKNLNDGHFLVDDRTKNGVDRFRGEHIHFGTEKFPNWEAVVAYLSTKATEQVIYELLPQVVNKTFTASV
jgi:5'(3')-deoxyribonucleotidase